MNAISLVKPSATSALDYLTFIVGRQMFAVRAVQVRDVLRRQTLAPIPLAPKEVGGLMNLRGHIVTALDLHVILSAEKADTASLGMSIVVEHRGEPVCLVVDRVGEVIPIAERDIEPNPASLSPALAAYARGVVKHESHLILVLDLTHLFTASQIWAAA